MFGAKAADTRVTVTHGILLVAVDPVDEAEAAGLCDGFCKSEKGQRRGVPWWNNVLPPQPLNNTYFGRTPKMAELGAGDKLYVVLRLSASDEKVSGGRSKNAQGIPAIDSWAAQGRWKRNEEFKEEEERKFEHLPGVFLF